MLQHIKKIITFLNYSNIWVAFNISILPILGAKLVCINFTLIQILSIFLLAWMSYSWPLYITVKIKNYQPKTEKETFFYLNKKNVQIFFIISTILATTLLSISNFTLNSYVKLFILGIISFIYIIPFLHTGLRQINFLKILVITFSWAFISILFLPINSQTLYFFGFQWASIFLITLPFDKKDSQIDSNEGLKTFENTLSIKNKTLLKLALSIIIILCVQGSKYDISSIALLTLLVILVPYKPQKWYFLYLDGLPFYQLILLHLTK